MSDAALSAIPTTIIQGVCTYSNSVAFASARRSIMHTEHAVHVQLQHHLSCCCLQFVVSAALLPLLFVSVPLLSTIFHTFLTPLLSPESVMCWALTHCTLR